MPVFYRLKKLAAGAMAAICLLSSLFAIAPDAGAVTPTYYVSNEYKSTKYYEALSDYKLTGDERLDVVMIALSQYGYHEGNSDADMHGGNADGHKNFAEYNRMYGKLDNGEGNGMSYGYSWCASFVSWCLRQARVASSTVETFVSCSKAVRNFRSQGIFKEASSGYIPKAGDIIFFVTPEEKANGYISSHVGFVIGTDSGFVYTVEGNTDNYIVCQKAYALDAEKIVGYAVPKYKTVEGTVYDFVHKTDMKYPGTYTVTRDTLKVCRESEKYNTALGSLHAGDRVEVKEVVLGWGLIDFGGSEGWIYLMGAEREQFRVTLNGNGGIPSISYHNKDAGVGLELASRMPRREGYTLAGWSTSENGGVELLPEFLYEADADATLYAVWRPIEYTVEFVDHDGRQISINKYTYGASLMLPASPARPADSQFTYEFSGWDKQVSLTVTADVVYRATYKATLIPTTTEPPVTTAPPPETTVPETTLPETTAEVTTALPETDPEPEVTTSPEVTTTPAATTAPTDEETLPPLLMGGCRSAALPSAVALILAAALCLYRKRI